MKRTAISLVLILCMVVSLNSTALAETKDTKATGEHWFGKLWELTYTEKDVDDVHKGSWTYLGKHTATRAGEYPGFEVSETYTHTFEGTISCSIKDVEVELGYSFGDSKTFGKTVYSDTLEKGETVKAYWIPTYSKSYIHQREIEYEMYNGEYLKYEPTGETKVAEGLRAIFPDIKFDYIPASSSTSMYTTNKMLNEPKPTKTEIYKANDKGEYYLSETIEY